MSFLSWVRESSSSSCTELLGETKTSKVVYIECELQFGNSNNIICLLRKAFLRKLKAMSHEAIFSCNLQRNGVSSCVLQEKLAPVTLLVCKIIRLQVIQQLAYVYNSTGACNVFFTQICVASCKKKVAACDSAFRNPRRMEPVFFSEFFDEML